MDSKLLEKSAKMPSKSTCNGEKIGLKMFWLIVFNPFRKWYVIFPYFIHGHLDVHALFDENVLT